MKKFWGCLVIFATVFACMFSLVACDFGGTSNTGGGNVNPDECKHSYGKYISDGNATCTQDGTMTAYCSKCGSKNTVPDVGSKRPHSFSVYIYDNNASCTQDGTKTAVCDICHTATDTEVALYTVVGHNYVNGACSVCHASHLTYIRSSIWSGNYAVSGIAEDCNSTEIVIPAMENGIPVGSIWGGAFKDNTSITKVTLSDAEIGVGAFFGCTALETVIFGRVVTVQTQAFAYCTSLESIDFPESVQQIGDNILEGCNNLKTVSFGKDVYGLSPNWFDGCTALESVNISEENPYYLNVGGIIYDHSMTDIVYVPYAISGKVAIADGFTKIPTMAFEDRPKITSIYIPKSVRTINNFAFSCCTSLTDIYYEGTEEDWNKVTKEFFWTMNAPEFTVHFNASIEE